MYLPRHAVPPVRSRPRIAAWLIGSSLWLAFRIAVHVSHRSAHVDLRDLGAVVVLAAGWWAKWMGVRTFKMARQAVPGEHEMLFAEMRKTRRIVEENVARLDECERAFEILIPQRPGLRVIDGGLS